MDKMQQRMIEERLGALADILKEIGHEFELNWTDSDGNIWGFNIKMENESNNYTF